MFGKYDLKITLSTMWIVSLILILLEVSPAIANINNLNLAFNLLKVSFHSVWLMAPLIYLAKGSEFARKFSLVNCFILLVSAGTFIWGIISASSGALTLGVVLVYLMPCIFFIAFLLFSIWVLGFSKQLRTELSVRSNSNMAKHHKYLEDLDNNTLP